MKKILEGSRAIAETIKLCRPAVVSAYPITPQTHIVENLAEMKASSEADFEYVRGESEFAAASIVLGASATGVRVYTATSSQGLLLMTEVLFNIAGLRLPVVMTCANRAISAPINIWNDMQDAVTVRDAGWIMLYAETNQEAVDMHIEAYKIAEKLRLPVMVNMDGFILTHTFEPVDIPSQAEVDKFLPPYKPETGQFLDINNPKTLGGLAGPEIYMQIREDLQNDLVQSKKLISQVGREFCGSFKRVPEIGCTIQDGLIEYIGTGKEKIVLVAMGAVLGTIKETIKNFGPEPSRRVGILKIRCFRPFPDEEVVKALKNAKYIAVVDKSISLGSEGILAADLKRAAMGKIPGKIQSFIVGLGGRDVTRKTIKKIVNEVKKKDDKVKFVY